MLTEREVKYAKPHPDGKTIRRLSDGDGLFLQVRPATPKRPTGVKIWKYRYSFGGERRTVSFGFYPYVGLDAARKKHFKAKQRLATDNVNPTTARHEEQLEQRATFAAVAKAWLAEIEPNLHKRTYNGKRQRVTDYLIPALGGLPVKQITTRHLASVVHELKAKRGNRHLVHRVKDHASQIMRWAVQLGYLDADVTYAMRGAIKAPEVTHRARLEDPKAIGALLAGLDTISRTSLAVRTCAQMMPYVFVRSHELRAARWSEFNLDAALWTIPGARMKQSPRGGKRPDHRVPLAHQVVTLLRALRRAQPNVSPFVFPTPKGHGQKSKTGHVSESTLSHMLERLGRKGTMTIHGWRGVAGTLLRDPLRFQNDVIDLQLAHKPKTPDGAVDLVRLAYDGAKFLADRTVMMQTWADYLDGLKRDADERILNGATVAA